MTERMDVITGRDDEKSGKTYWTRIGVAFPSKNGGWSVMLDALPVSGRMMLVEPKPKDGQNTGGNQDSVSRGEGFDAF